MMRNYLLLTILLTLSLTPFLNAQETDGDVLEYEDYVQMALPNLHHSCRTAWEATNGDETKLLEMIGPMIALSLFHREIDLIALAEERGGAEPLQAEFYETLKDSFFGEPDAMLVGVVDRAVAEVADAD